MAWGFADPPAPGGQDSAGVLAPSSEAVPQSTIEIVRLSALLQWLPLAGGWVG